ncbi:MAG: hypothetical protein L6R39_003453 [Caloplaca ligustica]|nr:MAG: hypothetical protein L6R39_003453 [Caloplaca ligustica]
MHPTLEIIQSWPKPNYVNPETRGPALTVVNIVFIILVVLVAALRFYTRIKITHSFGTDDWVIAASLVVVLVADNHYGWNRHSWDLHAHNGPHGYKLCLTAQILFFWAASLNKISLLCFYKRLTHGGVYKLWYKWCIIGGIAFITAMLIAFFLSAVFACQPLSAFWSPLATYPHKCIDEGNYMMSFAVITIILDFAILLLPIPLVMGLQLSKKQRIAVITLFGLGFIVCIAGIVQAYYIEVALKESYDETWDGWPLWVASAVEVDLGILCVSIPAIRPFLAIYVPKLLESTGISGKSSKQSSSSGSHSRNPFRYAARTANTPWAKDLAGGSWKKDKAGSTEKKDSEVVGVLEREVSGSEEREFGVDQDSKV